MKIGIFLTGFLDRFKKVLKYQILMKIAQVAAEFPHAGGRTGGRTGGQTDATRLIAAFRNFAKAPKPHAA